MKKLIRGIVDFRKNVRPGVKDVFARLALGQRPDTLFIACSDSRVVPNLFASSDPGDLFVVRNVGNLIPPCGASPESGENPRNRRHPTAARPAHHRHYRLRHSECGAMDALLRGRAQASSPSLKNWLRHADGSLQRLDSAALRAAGIERHNRLSQLNLVEQIEHLRTYPVVRERVLSGALQLHGWWFDIREADVYAYAAGDGAFHLIDEDYARVLLGRRESRGA